MEKFLSIIVLGLLWCNVSFSEISYTCFQTSYPKVTDGKPSINFGQLQFTISSNGSIYTQVDSKTYFGETKNKSEEATEIWDGFFALITKSLKTNIEATDEEKKSLNPFLNGKKTFEPHTKKFWDIRHSAGGIIQTVKELKSDGDNIEFWDFDLNKLEATYNYAWTPEFVRNWNKSLTNEDLKKLNRLNEKPFIVHKYQDCLEIGANDADQAGSSGTAFFINKKGYLLTNNHVVEGCTLSKISYKNKDYDTKLIATDKTLDLALLKAELKPKTFINFSNDEAKKLNKVYVAGYPLGKGLSDDLKISSGIVSSIKGFEDNSNEIQIDAPINPGNSGGPIINENGDLIAIAVAGITEAQNINFGIKSSAAERFLKSNNINVDKSSYSRSKNNEQLRNILEEGTVYTYCN
ncbi:S1C family serine protease [Candidatus Pelagibacter sp.]|nr:S1C family serine protease [Candidatus Pelagibacter sp.]